MDINSYVWNKVDLTWLVAWSKDNIYHYQHSPTGSDSWCKYNAESITPKQTCKPGTGLPKDIYKNKP